MCSRESRPHDPRLPQQAARIEHLERRVNQLDWYQQHIDQVINTLLVRVSTLEDELEELKA